LTFGREQITLKDLSKENSSVKIALNSARHPYEGVGKYTDVDNQYINQAQPDMV